MVGYIALENICNLFSDSILYFIIKMIICIVGFNVIFLICFGRTDEFKYIWRRLMKRMPRMEENASCKICFSATW